MKQQRVHYIGQYNIPKFYGQERMFSPAASKALYIIRTLNEIGYRVNFLSFTNSRLNKYCRARKASLNSMTKFYLAPFLPCAKYTERFMFLWLFIYAFLNIRKGDILLVWHTNSMRNDLLEKIVRWKKMQFIYEVEEVFTLVNNTPDSIFVNEEIEFLQCPHKYIFCNPSLGKIVNKKNLPSIICHGEYESTLEDVELDEITSQQTDKIKCVYAGIIDEVKTGALLAAKVACHLPPNYEIHILGFGSQSAISELNTLITEVNNDTSTANVYFHGRKSGADYTRILKNCDIALCLQRMYGLYNEISFPSKLLVYMCAGLPTVAPKIPCIAHSKLATGVYFYEEDSCKHIADTILSIDLDNTVNTKLIMQQMHNNFKTELNYLLTI